MTLKEASEFLGLSEKTISNNLKRTQESLERRGFRLIKRGWGSKAQYEIRYLKGDSNGINVDRWKHESERDCNF